MKDFILKLDKYLYLQEENLSLVIFKIFNKHNEIISIKKISYECNPILDVEILKLKDNHLIYVIKKLHKMIVNNEFKNRFLNPISKFKKELINDFFPEIINPITH